jgi:arylsulfatase A-like enzyme
MRLERLVGLTLVQLLALLAAAGEEALAAKWTNVVVICADDLGWGDLSCYGNTKVAMPNIDRLAEEGAKLTNFTSCCPFCAPARAGLQTGRYQFRNGLTHNPSPDPENDDRGLSLTELTLGNLFQSAGYRTACVGKWHLGHQPQFRPLRRGYDEYFGILYSNDMHPVKLYEGDMIVQSLVFQLRLTQRYTKRSLEFIEANRARPFFLYLAHAMPHKPLAVSDEFIGKSGAGLYGDVLMELDWSVGQVLDKLKELDLDENTIVLFTSDNGPWYGGSTGGLRGMKGQAWEGGLRVPLLARWPGHIPAGHVNNEPCTMPDLFSTALAAAGIALPIDRVIDGKDIMPLLTSDAASPHEAIYSMVNDKLCTVRSGKWKLLGPAAGPRKQTVMSKDELWTDPRGPDGIRILAPRKQAHPSEFPGLATGFSNAGFALCDLEADPGEQQNVAAQNPEVVERLKGYFEAVEARLPKESKSDSDAEDGKEKKEKKEGDKKAISDPKANSAGSAKPGANAGQGQPAKAPPAKEPAAKVPAAAKKPVPATNPPAKPEPTPAAPAKPKKSLNREG